MASRSYRRLAEDAESESRTHLPAKRSTYSTEEEFELSSRGGSNPHDDDAEPIRQQVQSDSRRPKPVRTRWSRSAIWQTVLNFALILPALYFLAFGLAVYSREGTPLDGDGYNTSLIEAAALGPTIFPIVFAAVVARFLKTAAAWRIERQGATVAVLEQLLGSRTVLSAVTLPFSLRLFNALTLPLVILWALSPIGGQSSRRVIYTGSLASTANLSYLDTNSAFEMGGSRLENLSYWPAFTAAYTSSLIAPSSIKTSTQDLFTNFKIPMIEFFDAPTLGSGNTSFVSIPEDAEITWSSLLGIPMTLTRGLSGSPMPAAANSMLPKAANSTFSVESSYWYLSCSELAMRQHDDAAAAGSQTLYTDFSKPPFEFRTEKDSASIHLGLPKHTRNSTGPRIIYWESLDGNGVTHTRCNLTTTYVESKVLCTGATCGVTAMRRSLSPFTSPHVSMLDYVLYSEDWAFFVNWLWATPSSSSSTWSNPNDIYFTNPASPYTSSLGAFSPDIATSISTETFNKRFSQLLNTAWLASIAGSGVTGQYEPTAKIHPPWAPSAANEVPDSGALYASRYTTANVQREHFVFSCNRSWLAVLVVSSLTMLMAGLAGMMLEMGRRGPDVLGAFSSLVRDNRHCGVEGSSSMLDGVELSRELAKERVRLGDVAQQSDVGHVAIGMANGETAVQRLRQGRLYR